MLKEKPIFGIVSWMELLERSGVQPSERLACFRGFWLRAPLKPLEHHGTMVSRDLRGPSIRPPLEPLRQPLYILPVWNYVLKLTRLEWVIAILVKLATFEGYIWRAILVKISLNSSCVHENKNDLFSTCHFWRKKMHWVQCLWNAILIIRK